MNHLKERAIKLRLKGFSYNEINRNIGIPKSTLSGWLHDIVLSAVAQKRIQSRVSAGVLRGLIKRNKAQTDLAIRRAEKIKENACSEIKKLTKYELLLAGAILYWAEGYKRLKVINGIQRANHAISLTNSDPEIVKLFIRFLREILVVPDEKIWIDMRIFDHLNENNVLNYWGKITGLPKSQFHKPQYPISKSSMGKRPFNRLPFGTIQIRVGDTQKFYKIIGWIDGIKKLASSLKKGYSYVVDLI